MTTNVTITNKGNVLVEFVADDGGSASCTLVGADKSEVEDRAEEFVETHDLKERAQS